MNATTDSDYRIEKPPQPKKIKLKFRMSPRELKEYNANWNALGEWYWYKANRERLEREQRLIEIEDKLIKLGYCI
jgi:hypothetical protein